MIIHNGKKYKLYKNGKEYKYVPKRGVHNLYIGGVGSYINSKSELATKLDTTVGNISDFVVVGQEVRAFIVSSFIIDDNAFRDDNYITYFLDLDSKIALNDFSFFNSTLSFYKSYGLLNLSRQALQATKLEELYFPNATFLGSRNLNIGGTHNVNAYLPSVLSLNSDPFEFLNNPSRMYAYLNPALQGNTFVNDFITAGGNVIWIQNTIPPNAITDLTVANVGGNDWQFNFTPPSSVNTIKGYRVFAFNGTILSRYKYNDTILNSGDVLTLPSNTSSVWVQVADQYLNLSDNSNIVKL